MEAQMQFLRILTEIFVAHYKKQQTVNQSSKSRAAKNLQDWVLRFPDEKKYKAAHECRTNYCLHKIDEDCFAENQREKEIELEHHNDRLSADRSYRSPGSTEFWN